MTVQAASAAPHGGDEGLSRHLMKHVQQSRRSLTASLAEAVAREMDDLEQRLVIECGCLLERALQRQESLELGEMRTEIEELRAEIQRGGRRLQLQVRAAEGSGAALLAAEEAKARERREAEARELERRQSEELGRRQAEDRRQAEEKREAEGRRMAEERRLAEEKRAQERRQAEERRAEEARAAEAKAAEEARQAQAAAKQEAQAKRNQESARLAAAEVVRRLAAQELAWQRSPEEEAAHRALQAKEAPALARPAGKPKEAELSAKQLQAKCQPANEDQAYDGDGSDLWIVVGGEDAGGIVVRQGESLKSQLLPARLGRGATVRDLETVGNRMHYKRIRGDGPDWGWVNVKSLNGKVLLEHDDDPPSFRRPL